MQRSTTLETVPAGHTRVVIDQARIAGCIGPPLDYSFRELTGSDDQEHIAALVARYRERYAESGYAENVLYPGIAESLQALQAAGVACGVCTSKRADFAVLEDDPTAVDAMALKDIPIWGTVQGGRIFAASNL